MRSPAVVRACIAVLSGVALLPSCATREVPTAFSDRAAASPTSAPGPLPDVGLAVREDLPLPGQPSKGWTGLAPVGTGMPAGHEHHHHHHGAPAGSAAPTSAPAPGPSAPPMGTGHVH